MLLIPARVKELKDAGRKEGREERDGRYAEARERFGRYDANGEFVLPYTDEVRRFLAGEDVVPEAPVNRGPLRRNRRNRRPR